MKPKTVTVTFKSRKSEQGQLRFTKEFSAKYNYRRPRYFTINDIDFKLSHITSLDVM